ncbi:ribonucleotide reductase [Zavarzinia aquatilis]|uniref:ribonucleoside-diphosphate reductase n=1 Tax=Zavarzinia aquatilis TaxID=2211142 RepID=A0A317ED60_9PROT|nr:ribonucleotide reductase [Zavarzinia aquatilis]PWR24968.1 ribonucleotide reductase [Zavarzinia aquatilis]
MPSPDRQRLPNRRLCLTDVVSWHGADWLLSIGFDHGGRVREVFLSGPKCGSEIEATLADACILVSLLLQHDHEPAALLDRLSRDPVSPEDPAASPIGLVLERLAAMQASGAEAAREAYAAAAALGRLAS